MLLWCVTYLEDVTMYWGSLNQRHPPKRTATDVNIYRKKITCRQQYGCLLSRGSVCVEDGCSTAAAGLDYISFRLVADQSLGPYFERETRYEHTHICTGKTDQNTHHVSKHTDILPVNKEKNPVSLQGFECCWHELNSSVQRGIFLPELAFSADSLTQFVQLLCAIACIKISVRVKNPNHQRPHSCLDTQKWSQ